MAFSTDSEQQLLQAVKQACGHVEAGMTPTEAIVKVASDNRLPRTFLPLMVQSYNQGRIAYQRQSCGGEGILCKMANFPIARIEDVQETLYPSSVISPAAESEKTAVDRCYSRPPQQLLRDKLAHHEKVAEMKLPTPAALQEQVKQADPYDTMLWHRRLVDQSKSAVLRSRDNFLIAMGQLGDYFKQADCVPFNEVEYNASRLLGQAAKHAMDYVYDRNKMRSPRSTGIVKTSQAVELTRAPYSLIVTALDRGRDLLMAQRALTDAEKTARDRTEETTRPFDQPPTVSHTSLLGGAVYSEKQAGFYDALLGGAVSGATQSYSKTLGRPTPDLVSDAEMSLTDPAHENELQGIQARAIMNDFIANDDVISGYDPDEVTNAYNEIVQLAPRIRTQPAVLRPLLRKRLTAGSVEPFEAAEMANIEKSLHQSQGAPHTSQVLNASAAIS